MSQYIILSPSQTQYSTRSYPQGEEQTFTFTSLDESKKCKHHRKIKTYAMVCFFLFLFFLIASIILAIFLGVIVDRCKNNCSISLP